MRYTLQVFIAVVGILAGAVVSGGDTYAEGGKKDKDTVAVPRVVDANNNIVGQVVGTGVNAFNGNPFVALNIQGFSFVVGVTPNIFVGNAPLSFTTANCTGQAYFDVLIASQVLPTVAVVNGTVYGPRTNSTPVGITYQSIIQAVDVPPHCISTNAIPINAYQADPIVDLSTQFTPPYRFVYN